VYRVDQSKQAEKDEKTARRAGLGAKFADIMSILERDPYDPAHHFERLTGNLKGYFSRKIDKGNRFLYEVLPNTENARDENGNLYSGIVRVYESWEHNYKKPPK
jgi:Txe/YoeB family toxin of Txe-Axe toxin-antitoxin module